MRNPLFLGLFFLTVALINCAWAQETPKYSNEFLAIGVGARGLAMANTQVAIVEDATAGYYNPAGLLNIKTKYSVTAMHASLFAGIANYDYVSFATPIDTRSALGVSVIRLGIDDIPDTRFLFDSEGRLDYSRVQSFSSADYAFIFSYARRFPRLKDFRFGANAKIIHRSAGIFANAWGFGFDLGAQYFMRKWQFGASLRDVTSTFNVWTINPDALEETFNQTNNTLPNNSLEVTLPRLVLGASRYVTILKNADATDRIGLLSTVGVDVTFDGQRNTPISNATFSADPHAGIELHYRQTVFVRGGVGAWQAVKNFDGTERWTFQPNFGLGLQIKNFTVDYALTDVGNQAEALYSHIFSLRLSLNKSANAQPRKPYERD